MFLVSAKVGPFKSITAPQTVKIEDAVTVLVGMNESGKTVFLQALEKSNPALELARFDPVEDYPRKDLPAYLKQHKTKAAEVTQLTYQLTDEELQELNDELHSTLPSGFQFSVSHSYDNKTMIVSLSVTEQPILNSLLAESSLSSDTKIALQKITSLRAIPEALQSISLTEEDKAFLQAVEARIAKTQCQSVVQWEAWQWLKQKIPKFLYFGEYEILPSQMNLADLAQRVEQAKSDPKRLTPEHRAVLALLRMADIAITDFTTPGGYETLKAKLEGVSISLTDQIMEFWKQNEDLEVEVDIKADTEASLPYNNGSINSYISNARGDGNSEARNKFFKRSWLPATLCNSTVTA